MADQTSTFSTERVFATGELVPLHGTGQQGVQLQPVATGQGMMTGMGIMPQPRVMSPTVRPGEARPCIVCFNPLAGPLVERSHGGNAAHSQCVSASWWKDVLQGGHEGAPTVVRRVVVTPAVVTPAEGSVARPGAGEYERELVPAKV